MKPNTRIQFMSVVWNRMKSGEKGIILISHDKLNTYKNINIYKYFENYCSVNFN